MRRVFNNIIVKGFQQDPARVEDHAHIEDRKAYLEKLFAPFGKITSLFVTKVNSKKPNSVPKLMAFICYNSPDTAAKAVEEMTKEENSTVDGCKLYVAEAL